MVKTLKESLNFTVMSDKGMKMRATGIAFVIATILVLLTAQSTIAATPEQQAAFNKCMAMDFKTYEELELHQQCLEDIPGALPIYEKMDKMKEKIEIYARFYDNLLGTNYMSNSSNMTDPDPILPYCDTPEGEAARACHDRKDWDDLTGLYPCNDGMQEEDWRDCPDVSKPIESELYTCDDGRQVIGPEICEIQQNHDCEPGFMPISEDECVLNPMPQVIPDKPEPTDDEPEPEPEEPQESEDEESGGAE